jgi:putative membrane protein
MSGFVPGNYVPGLGVVDPFAAPQPVWSGILNAVMATALFRCWHILLFFSAWATAITYVHMTHIHDLAIQSTLLTVCAACLSRCP